MELDTIRNKDFHNHRVLVRVDFNVPMDAKGRITDDSRIREALPTLQYILAYGGSLIILSHLGRPKGVVQPGLSLKPIAENLAAHLGQPIIMAPDVCGAEVQKLACELQPGDVLLLENLRFHPEEEHPTSDVFAKELAKLGTFYVNDAFGCAHRNHSSVYHIAQYFPQRTAAGFLLEKEVDALTRVFACPIRPFFAVVGGAKIGTKIGVLKKLIEKTDALFIGGAMAFTFFKAKGIDVACSLVDDDYLQTVRDIMRECASKKVSLHLPSDIVITDDVKTRNNLCTVSTDRDLPKNSRGVDIGPATIELWSQLFREAKTIFWNGPMGVFEIHPFDRGTIAIAENLAKLDADVVVGGGDSAAAIRQLGCLERFFHVSTGGGATLEFIEKGSLDTINLLQKR